MRFDRAMRPLRGLADAMVIISGWWLILFSVLTCVEIVGRKLFRFSFQGIDEIGEYSLAVIGAICLSYTLLTRGHTRIDFLVKRLPQAAQAGLNWLAIASLAGLALFAAARGYVMLSESIEFKSVSTTPLQTPTWLPHSLWLLGWLLFALNAVLLAAHATYLLFSNRARLNRAYGPETLEEQLEAEVGEALRRAPTRSER